MALADRDRVDLLLVGLKMIAGKPEWAATDYEGQRRWLAPLSLDGEGTNMALIVNAWPSSPGVRYNIVLRYKVAVMRLDGWEQDRHNNHPIPGVVTPPTIQLGWIFG